ncbi:hypothetical protein QBC39DRAFT_417852 [Podospora conica]|nr:hypothetical protein QBC39DRAFT_417852 [Schizothecium conicum]
MALRFRNLDLDSFESELKNKSGRKGPRVRQSKSCLECRTRRKRCSRELPCTECHHRGAPLECVYTSTPRYTRPHADPLPSPPDLSEVNSPAERASASPQSTGHGAETDSDPNTAQGYHVAACSPTLPESPAAMTMSKPAGTTNIFQTSGLKTRMFSLSHWLAPCREMTVLKAFLDHSTEFQSTWSAFGELKVLLQACNPVPASPSLSRTDSDGTGLRTLLPDRAQCDGWVTKFCQSYNRIYGIIHPAALRDDVRQVYAGTLTNPVHVARVIMAVAIAMQDSEADRMHGRMLAREVEDCINSSLRFQKPCIGAVQNLLLLLLLKTISASDTDKMHDMLSLQGLTGQIMFNMGLHRDPAPFPGMTPYYAELRKRLWACYLRLSLDFCMRSGTLLSISLDETDCPLPTATNLGSLRSFSGHYDDATSHDQELMDASFAVVAAKLTSIIAPVYRQLHLPNPPSLAHLHLSLRPSLESFMTSLPPPLRPSSTSDPILHLQQSLLSIPMQTTLTILTLNQTLPSSPSHRAALLETFDLATSTLHHFPPHPSAAPAAHHLLWSHLARAALTACFVVGRLRALDARPSSLLTNTNQSTRVFHTLLHDALAALSVRLRARAHLGPVAARVSLIVAVAAGVTEQLFADDVGDAGQRLLAEGVRTAGREVGEMKAALVARRGRVTTPAMLPGSGWGATGSTPGAGGCGMGPSGFFGGQDFMSHDGGFGSSMVPDFCFGGDGEVMGMPGFCPGQFGDVSVGFESLWE